MDRARTDQVMRINIKPISVNKAWKGRRFKTDEYKAYQQLLLYMLPDLDVPDGELELIVTFGFSSLASDFDNPVKPFVDCLQKRYGFNDKLIKRAVIEVRKVDRGSEFIEFELNGFARG